ncbi:MAG TPA: secondary thiamine-phosphate synthase enzyme YjbQ [Candidatus Paceibacterota bacterium]|nr:secondary thiamine-phosphate synthase enzyme YjbQ [Candidatus Paceibacterota bacterium]HOL54214.1 secondary thiamine-phosphate synthase enzyme YjbQ [Candidatus Paceibacterota bacterium]HPP17106.1 secondary thiamine-phosphate synthase enzyme YjbQ [Candidatus Paceibacterota bacterium]HRU33705.1 secondary thiamine-phosphate synthase enzyme YjbQ [Candidatus Paceibacterota bacterium]
MKFTISTQGHNDVIDITEKVKEVVVNANIKNGLCLIFCPGSTVGITALEAEPNLINDFKEFLEKNVPADKNYRHDETWGEKNGFSHLRSALIKPFFVVPIENGELILGTWQQIVLVDFDSRPRQREVIVETYYSKD